MPKPEAPIRINVTFRHTESTDALKAYASDKLIQCIQKFISTETEVSVVLMVEKRDHIAEVNVRAKGFDASAKAVTEDLYSAIDKVTDNIMTQLRKQKERIVDHKAQAVSY